MFPKCVMCKSRILGGGRREYSWQFCSDGCWDRFRQAVGARFSTPELVEEVVNKLFLAECPKCRRGTHNDIYSATKITGMLVMYQIQSSQMLCCASCGRKHRLAAAAHCLFAGWWGPRAAICNLFVLPTNLIAAAFIRQPKQPSRAIVERAMISLGDLAIPRLLSGELKLSDDGEEDTPTLAEAD